MRGFIDRDEQDWPRRRIILWIGIGVATPIAMVLLFGLVFVALPAGVLCLSPPLAWAIGAFIASTVGRGRLIASEPLGHPAPVAPSPRPGPLVYRPWPATHTEAAGPTERDDVAE